MKIEQSVYETGGWRITIDKATGVVTVVEKATGKVVSENLTAESMAATFPVKSQSRLYLGSILGMAAMGLIVFFLIAYSRPEDDITIIGSVVFGFVTLSTIGLFQFIKQLEVRDEAREAKYQAAQASSQAVITHDSVNSRMDAMNKRIDQALAEAIEAAFLKGKKVGSEEADARTDKLAVDKISAEKSALPK